MIEQRTYVPETTTPITELREGTSPSREAELYSLLVPVIKNVVSEATKFPPPSTLMDFPSLQAHSEGRLGTAIDLYVRNPQTPVDEQLTQLASEHPGAGSLTKLLKNGAGTASACMVGVLKTLPRAYQAKYGEPFTDPQRPLDIADQNYLFIVRNAMQHIVDLNKVANYGKTNPSQPSFITAFSYLELDTEDKLYYPESFLKTLPNAFQTKRVAQASQEREVREVIGCPAAFSNAVFKLWIWELVAAKGIYERQMEERKIPVSIFPGRTSLSAD